MTVMDVRRGSPLLQLDLDPEKLGLERIERLRRKMQDRVASLCSERAMIYTRVFREFSDEPFMKRKALAFAATLREMTVYVEPDSLIFGNQASRNFAAPIFPEYSIDWVVDELDEFALRTGDAFQVSEEVKADLRSIHSFWHGRTHEDEVNAHITQKILDAQEQGLIHRGGISNSGDGHIIPNHEKLFSHGYRGLINEMKLRLLDESLTDHQRLFYECSIICLEGALDYIKRYRPILKEMVEQSDGPERRQELERMAELSLTLLEDR